MLNNISNVKLSEKQFLIQKKFFSEVYSDFQDLKTFKLYIYLCRNFDYKFERFKTAKSIIQSELSLNSKELNDSLDWLENNHFIKRTNTNKHQMYQAKILVAPEYDVQNNIFLSNEELRYNRMTLKSNMLGYVMLPTNLFTNAKLSNTNNSNATWTSNKLKVLIMLYSHFWFEYFGGVNPDIVSINSSGQVVELDPSFYYSLKMSEVEVNQTINSLVNSKLFEVVEVCFKKYFNQCIYIADKAELPNFQDYLCKSVLRPKHISEKQMERLIKSKKKRESYI